MRKLLLDFGSLAVLALTLAAGPAAAQNTVVTTEGPVQGVLDSATGVWEYRGIPYAAAPVGDLRFARPGAPALHTGVSPAATFPNACPQITGALPDECSTGLPAGTLIGSEDCLGLNVFAPPPTSPPRPVMVFIHGGAFVNGCARASQSVLAAQGGVLLVTLQYRLGVLGFLSSEETSAEDPDGSSGNWGMLDQIRALEWVKANASAFGGDPENITIFGESAGAVAVCALLASPLTEDLFQRAIMESGNCQIARPLRTTPGTAIEGSTGVDVGRGIATTLGCPASGPESLACLRGLPVSAITPRQGDLAAAGIAADQTTLDGHVLEERPLVVFQESGVGRREVIIGSNRDEMTGFVNFDAALVSQIAADYTAAVTARLGPVAPVLLPLYPAPADPAQNLTQYNLLFGELNFNCPVVDVADALASHSDPTRVYHFTQTQTTFVPALAALGSFHGMELAYVFGDVDRFFPFFAPTAADAALSSSMIRAWSGFAADGTPAVTPTWPLWNPAAPLHYEFNGALADPVRDEYRGGRCPALIAAITAVDSDRDFVGNEEDNCPALGNSSQSDLDADLLGDRCDRCPASVTSATLQINGCDTHVANRGKNGCTLADEYAHCKPPKSRRLLDKLRYSLCVLEETIQLRRTNTLRYREGVAVAKCLLR